MNYCIRNRLSYPFGVLVIARGRRLFDEGGLPVLHLRQNSAASSSTSPAASFSRSSTPRVTGLLG
jgi:hypothetical protein